MKLRGIILDFDGTLVDSEPWYFRANRDAFAAFGHKLDEQEYYHHWSLMGAGIHGEIERHGLEGIDTDRVRAVSRENYRHIVETETIPLMPYARELLTNLPALGFRVIIASNTSEDLIRSILSGAGFNAIPVPIVGGDAFRPKPDPAIFLAAAQQTGLDKRQCLILEDTDKGVRAARAAGIPFAVIHCPLYSEYSPEDAIAKFADLESFYRFLTMGAAAVKGQ